MRLSRGDVDDYQELYALADRAGWRVQEIKVLEGNVYEVPLERDQFAGTMGTWRGNLAQFRYFCALVSGDEAQG